MADLNKVCLVGRLVRNPELRTTLDGKRKFAAFTIAVQGNSKEKVYFIDAVCGIESQYNTLCNSKGWFVKGSPIAIDGEINQGTYQNKKGETVNAVRINARNIYFVPQSKKEDGSEKKENIEHAKEGDLPF